MIKFNKLVEELQQAGYEEREMKEEIIRCVGFYAMIFSTNDFNSALAHRTPEQIIEMIDCGNYNRQMLYFEIEDCKYINSITLEQAYQKLVEFLGKYPEYILEKIIKQIKESLKK